MGWVVSKTRVKSSATVMVGHSRSVVQDESGSAAVEFALVAAPFFALLFAILQLGLVFLTGQVLDNATSDAARMIRTGEVQSQGMGETQFRQTICAKASILPGCTENLKLDVRVLNNFNAANMGGDISSGELDDDNFGFQVGAGNQIILVRVFYEWPIYVPFMAVPDGTPIQYSDLASGNYLLTSALVFRNEPF